MYELNTPVLLSRIDVKLDLFLFVRSVCVCVL